MGVQEDVQVAIASLAGVQVHKRDVSASLSPSRPSIMATFRRLASGIAEAHFSIEVPAEEKVVAVGEVLNSNTLAHMSAMLSVSSVLRQYGAEAVALTVDGLPAQNRTAEMNASKSSGGLPPWALVSLTLLFIIVLVMNAAMFYSMRSSKVSKRGGLTYRRSASASEEFDGDQEREISSSDAERI